MFHKLTKANLTSATFFLALFTSILASAHGEDKYGPHGGHIRMPGAFHTELVVKDSKNIEVFLLDINFSNPLTTDSNVDIKATIKGQTQSLSCTKASTSFLCTSKQELTNAVISVSATRNRAKGNEAIYKLPLPQLHGKHKSSENENAHHHH